MSMNFNKPLTEDNQSFLREFMGEDLVALDQSKALFDTRPINQQAVKHIANELNQVVTVELNEPGEIKTMSDGTRYEVTPDGWKKLL